MKLYELTEIYKNIEEIMSDEDANVETLEKALKEVEDGIENKAENIAKLIRHIDSDIDALRAEEKRLAQRRRALENKKKSIKDYLEMQLKAMEIDKVKTPLFTVSIQKNPPSVRIIDEDKIPEDYLRYTKSISRRDVLQALKDGEEIPGAELKQTRSLRIR